MKRMNIFVIGIAIISGVFLFTKISPNTNTNTPNSSEQELDEGGIGDLVEVHPLQITEMRKKSYPGSDLVIEDTLFPGSNYNQYVVSYQSDGNKIYALLTIPTGEKPAGGWPAIVFNHGFIPPLEYRTTERYVAYVDSFARNGYIVLKSDYRGHGFSEGVASGGYGNTDYTVDVLNAYTSLAKNKEVNKNRMGMWGHSMGGYITLRAMVINPEIKAGVIWAGVVASYPDLINNWRRPSPGVSPQPSPTGARRWRQAMVEKYGTPSNDAPFWRSISSNFFLSDISGPLQLHHGTVDESVPVQFSRDLEKQMKDVQKEVEYYEYPGDEHNITVSFNTAMQRSIEFFDTHVKNLGL